MSKYLNSLRFGKDGEQFVVQDVNLRNEILKTLDCVNEVEDWKEFKLFSGYHLHEMQFKERGTGGTVTNVRNITDFIPLALNGTTYIPLEFGTNGAEYHDMTLWNSTDTDTCIWANKVGGKQEQVTGKTHDMTLIADPTVETAEYNPSMRVIRFNPEFAQYYRCYMTDDSTTCRVRYTYTEEQRVENAIDLSNGYIFIGRKVSTEEKVGTFLGQQCNVNAAGSITETDVVRTFINKINLGQTGTAGSTTLVGTPMDGQQVNGKDTFSSNYRIQSEPIELKHDGLIIKNTLLDTNGVGYGVIAFLNENLEVVETLNGVSGMGACEILQNEFTKKEGITKAEVTYWGAPTANGGTINRIEVCYPDSEEYKYVIACVSGSQSGKIDDFYSSVPSVYFTYKGIEKTVYSYVNIADALKGKFTDTDLESNDKYTWSRMYGAEVCLFGGSFATATYGIKAHEYWQEKLGIKLTNYAVGGAGVIAGVGATPMLTQVNNMVRAGKKFDLYIIWCSTNDLRNIGDKWKEGESVSVAGHTYPGIDFNLEIFGEEGSSDTSTQRGGLNEMIRAIRKHDINAKILLFTSMRHFTSENGYKYAIDQGASTRTFVDDQISVCNYWSIPYLDQFREWGVMPDNKSVFVRSDNLHPTDEGYLRIAAMQVDAIARM